MSMELLKHLFAGIQQIKARFTAARSKIEVTNTKTVVIEVEAANAFDFYQGINAGLHIQY